MGYSIKEIYYTIQGEGANTGRAAVFCRFAGCNLWSGHEEDRATAICKFCDTDFVGTDGPGGGWFETAADVGAAAAVKWPREFDNRSRPLVVCTGGEPLLQLDEHLVGAFHGQGFEIAVETNGSRHAHPDIDWVCVSPKAGVDLVLTSGDELKLVYPQPGAEPELFEELDFSLFLLQPMDGSEKETHTRLAAEYCLKHPRWRLSLQTHKFIGIP